MTEYTPWLSLLGGGLIGVASTLLMLFHGRIAGLTGITSGLLPPFASDRIWRVGFLAGAILAPAIMLFAGVNIEYSVPVSTFSLIAGGLIVGFGVYFSSGCTSGHGVCGVARLSNRSIAATVTFFSFTLITVYFIRHVLGA